MTFLDVLVDGEIVKEAMLLDLSDGEEVIYKGPSLQKDMQKISYFILKEAPLTDYLILAMCHRKFLLIKVSKNRHLIIGLSPEVNAEAYLEQIRKIISKIGDRKVKPRGFTENLMP